MPVNESYCLTCGRMSPFEQPPCSDRHGAECPERACVRCGAADLVGLWLPVRTIKRQPRKKAAA